MTIEISTSGMSGMPATFGDAPAPRLASASGTGAPILNATGIADTQAEPSADSVKEAARALQEHAQKAGSTLEFSVDDSTDRVVVIVRDISTGDIVRQIPNKEVLWLAAHIDQASSALLSSVA